jgi:hypothetical protein
VYSGLTLMPSKVFQFSALTSPFGADFAAARSHDSWLLSVNFGQASGLAALNSVGFWLMATHSFLHRQDHIIYNY